MIVRPTVIVAGLNLRLIKMDLSADARELPVRRVCYHEAHLLILPLISGAPSDALFYLSLSLSFPFASDESGLNLRSGISMAAATNEIAAPYALPNIYQCPWGC